jgi:hypothetical protein
MEWRAIVLACDRETLDTKAKCVALALSTHMDTNGASCFPSLSTLERETSLSRTAVCKALNMIERAGLIERVRGGPVTATRYRACSAQGALGVVREAHSGSARGAPESDQESVKSLSTRAHARAGRKTGRARTRDDDTTDPDLLAYDQ